MQTAEKQFMKAEDLSLLGKRWALLTADEAQVTAYAQRFDLEMPVARLLVQRDIPMEEVEAFLKPTMSHSMPDPYLLKDMDKAVTCIMAAIKDHKKIALYGDYDVDGATSTAIFYRLLKAHHIMPDIYIPDRQKEGYGANEAAVRALKEKGAELIIFMDCGTTSFDPIDVANELEIETVIVDHHMAQSRLPKANAIINPNRLDESEEARQTCGHMAAVGVTFLLLAALNTALAKVRGKRIDLMKFLDFVALGTVCDVVPLKGVNRAMVTQGLKILNQRENTGLQALCEAAGAYDEIMPYHLGFVLGPRLNAGGRVGTSDMATRLLTTDDGAEATEIAQMLNENNLHRRELEKEALAQAELQAAEIPKDDPLIMVWHKDWHPGVVGLVASRLQDQYYKPVFAMSVQDGVAKASGRSIEGVDLGAHVMVAKEAGLLLTGGGHAMAAGLSVAEERIGELHAFLLDRVSNTIDAQILEPQTHIDAKLSLQAANFQLLSQLNRVSPFGQGNPTPRLMLHNVAVDYPRVLKDRHVACTFKDGVGNALKAICFNSIGTPLGEALVNGKGKSLDVVGQLKENRWQGNTTLQFHIYDAALSRG